MLFRSHAIQIPIPERATNELERIEAAALAAADRATASWRDEAIAHFRKASEENFIELPSGKTKVSWDFSDPEHLVLVVRVACPIEQRVKVEQAVFRDTWRALASEPQHLRKPAESS